MAGVPVSPPFQNPVTNGLDSFNTPAVAPGAVGDTRVTEEARRQRFLLGAYIFNASAGGNALVSGPECGAKAVAAQAAVAALAPQQAVGAVVAPPWFAPVQLQLNQIQQQQNQMLQQQNQMLAKIDNMPLFNHNHQIVYGHITRENLQFPYKMVPGFAQVPPIHMMVHIGGVPVPIAAVFSAPAPLPGLSVIPPPATSNSGAC